MDALPVIVAIIAGCLALYFTFGLFFSCRDDLFEAMRHWFTPDIISMFRGEWAEDMWNETKLFFWMAVGGLAAYGAFTFTESLLS